MFKKLNLKKLSVAVAVLGLAVGGSAVAVEGISNATSSSIVQAAVSTSQIKLTRTQAVKKFTQKFGNKSIESISLKPSGNKYVYTVEGFDSTKEYEVKVNAKTGKIISSKSERLDADDHKSAVNLKKAISRSSATKIAKKHASGKAVEWTLEKENGKSVWVVEFANGTEVEINALTKKVISVEKDD